MQSAPNYFEPIVTPRNLTIARRTNALIRYVAPGSSLSDVMPAGVVASFEDKLEESFCGEGSCARKPQDAEPLTGDTPEPAEEAVEAAVEAAVAQRSVGGPLDPQCCAKCSRTFLREAEVLKRVQHMLNLLANLSRGDLEVLRGLIDAKLAASVPELPRQDSQKAGPPLPRTRGY